MPRPLHLGLNKESDTFLEFGKSQFTRSTYLTLSFETLSSISEEMIQSFSLNELRQANFLHPVQRYLKGFKLRVMSGVYNHKYISMFIHTQSRDMETR